MVYLAQDRIENSPNTRQLVFSALGGHRVSREDVIEAKIAVQKALEEVYSERFKR